MEDCQHDWITYQDDAGQNKRICSMCKRQQIVVEVHPAGETGEVGAKSKEANGERT